VYIFTCILNCVFLSQGQPPHSNSTMVIISFLPSTSTGFPTFTPLNSTNFQILQNSSVGTPLATITASSPSLGGNTLGGLSYYISGGNIGDTFTVNIGSRSLNLARSLADISTKSFILWIEACDSSTPPLSSFISVNVSVIQVNIRPPTFNLTYYSSAVTEDQSPPVDVIAVTASDAWTEQYGGMTYSLAPTSDFTINALTGLIQTAVSLEQDKTPSYLLVVFAIDHVRINHRITWL